MVANFGSISLYCDTALRHKYNTDTFNSTKLGVPFTQATMETSFF